MSLLITSESPSLRGRGLKLTFPASLSPRFRSPSLRGRGLKCSVCMYFYLCTLSPSLRGRGLKSQLRRTQEQKEMVALFTRAWIEIARADFLPNNLVLSPSLRGRGLKSRFIVYIITCLWSPSLRGRGLKYYS